MNKKTPTKNKIQEFIDVMSKTRRLMKHSHIHSHGADPVTTLQMHGLTVLSNHPGSTVGELAEKFMMSSASIAQFLGRLQEAELIEKRQDEQDRRVTRLYLSKKGKKKIQQMQSKFYKHMEQILEPLSATELDSLIKIHKKLLINLEHTVENENC